MISDGRQAREYHEFTKHHPNTTQPRRHVDASLIPRQYKRYTGIEPLSLPAPARSGASFFETLAADGAPNEVPSEVLAALLHYSAGVVRRSRIGGGEVEFRAAACTGALYHVEVYAVCAALGEGLPAGLYHFDAPLGVLRRLRDGDYRGPLAAAVCDERPRRAPISLVLTSTFWRNSWRYEERAYRHVFWDAGTLLANVLAVAAAWGLAPAVHAAFDDAVVHQLLGVDPRREAAVCVVALGRDTETPRAVQEVPNLRLEAEPLSRAEIEYPLIWRTHEASNLQGCDAVAPWCQAARRAAAAPAGAPPAADSSGAIEDVIERRGSARRFRPEAIARSELEALLSAASAPLQADFAVGGLLSEAFVIANRVEGLQAGVYHVEPDGALASLRVGDFAATAGHLALDQPLAGQAAANVYFVTDLAALTTRLGDRGYRAAQLEAGVRSGRVYLAATALGLRATGLTFYDDEAARFLGLELVGAAVLMLMAVGR